MKTLLENLDEKRKNKTIKWHEEDTKATLIEPLLDFLGYSRQDRDALELEGKPDLEDNKKVEYQLLDKNREPIVCVEAKPLHTDLKQKKIYNQVKNYFNNSRKLKLAILTNGYEYRFFTDFTDSNMLDSEPCFEFKLDNITDDVINFLLHFRYGEIQVEEIKSFAREKIYYSKLREYLRQQIKSPDDDFVTPFAKHLFNSASRSNKGIIRRILPNIFTELFNLCHANDESENQNEGEIENIKTRKGKVAFFNEFKKYISMEEKSRLEFKPPHSNGSYLTAYEKKYNRNQAVIRLKYFIIPRDKKIDVRINLVDGQEIFDLLKKQKNEFESKIDNEVTWKSPKPNKKTYVIGCSKDNIVFDNVDKYEEYFDWWFKIGHQLYDAYQHFIAHVHQIQ
ncbi:MAG: DUF4268 domain-containing protein [Flavobacteriaceae bacterium]|nr:DUF4268 domain-containing protein [Flavobacteriaceae bacterium]